VTVSITQQPVIGTAAAQQPTAGATPAAVLFTPGPVTANTATTTNYAITRGALQGTATLSVTINDVPVGGEDRAPFQIMSLKNESLGGFGAPGSNHTVAGVLSSPMGGTAPHIMTKSLINYMVDATFTGITPALTDPPGAGQVTSIANRFSSSFGITAGTQEIVFLNMENAYQSWVDVASFSSAATVSAAVPDCVTWVQRIRAAAPQCMIAWYSMPSNVRRARSMSLLTSLTPLQDALCNELDILAPEVYMWNADVTNTATFNTTFNTFRSKIAYVRDRYPSILLCPAVWEAGLVVLSQGGHNRTEGQVCPVNTTGNNTFANYETYRETGQAFCAIPAMTRAQFQSILNMLFDEGCDGVFYWSHNSAYGSYWSDANYSGIRDFHLFASQKNGAVPVGDHTATFLQDIGPFAP
jgi:hypothetical protein